jgi:acetyl-CoA synthetase
VDWPIIRKIARTGARPANLADYERARREFSWVQARAELAGLPGGSGLNIADEAVDRHVRAGRGAHVALRWLARDDEAVDFSYADLAGLSNRFANVLGSLGVQRGERVFTLLGRVPALYVAALGTWKHGAVLCPLFAAFGPEPIAARMAIAEPAVLVANARLFERKVVAILDRLPYLRHVILVEDSALHAGSAAATTGSMGSRSQNESLALKEMALGCHRADFQTLLDAASPTYEIAPTDPEALATLHFTSGTTGRPKAAMHVHAAVIAHRATAIQALDLRSDDVYWCTADPGWVTGTSYGIIGPLAVGCTLIADAEEFDAERWYRTLAGKRVNVWYTAPTAIRMLMKAGDELPRRFDLSALRYIASVGEPLNPEAVLWGERVLGLPIHDNWWQTETGGIMVSNFASMDIKPGSMGRPLPGIDAAVLRVDDAGRVEPMQPGEQGELALKAGWPSMFRGYLGEDERYRRCFVDGWYRSGDIVRRDGDGYFWFVGRGDDVIKSAGHLIGPFEVESALMEHPAVAEAAAVGIPDPIALEVVKVFVALKPGFVASDALSRELLALARKRLGPAVAPREIAFRDSLPKTRSGKIMRRLLRARELGLPEGDLSTLEGGA